MGARTKELCEAAGGRIVTINGQTFCEVPNGTSEQTKAAIASAPSATIQYHDLTNPPQRPTNARRKDYFHLATSFTAATETYFFAVVPATPFLHFHNFDNSGIKENMEIMGIKALMRPQSWQDVDSTYCTATNQYLDAGWELLVNRTPVVDGSVLDIAPTIKWEPGSAANQYTTSLIRRDFYWFRRELGMQLDKLVVTRDDVITVRFTFPTAFTSKSGMYIGCALATRPAKKAVLL